MATQIAPSVGAGILFTQGGVGAAPGYAAIDVRRGDGSFIAQGIINTGAYLVSQRGAGANMSVDIAANAGSACVLGTTIANQGPYTVPPHSAVINEVIAAADPTNPRIDQVILQCFDNTIDSSGNSKAQTAVLTGTPTPGATLANRSGAAALPASSMRLADVLVPAASASVTNANIKDRRPKTRGKSIIATTESRTNAAYGLMPTPDQITELVVPTDTLLAIAYQATWQEATANNGRAAIFIGPNQLQIQTVSGTSQPSTQAAYTGNASAAIDAPLFTGAAGLFSVTTTGGSADVTTGQIVGGVASSAATSVLRQELAGAALVSLDSALSKFVTLGGPVYVFVAAGTYDISVQFKAASGAVTAKNRRLWVWQMNPDMGVVA